MAQRHTLSSVAREATRWSKDHRKRPVAWRAIDHGSTSVEANEDHQSACAQWNIEQASAAACARCKGVDWSSWAAAASILLPT